MLVDHADSHKTHSLAELPDVGLLNASVLHMQHAQGLELFVTYGIKDL